MTPDCVAQGGFEISPRFRRSIEGRIARLEQGADFDESQMAYLDEQDHVRRQMKLIAAQRAEALRMRLFLDRAGTRTPWKVEGEHCLNRTPENQRGMVD